MDWNNTDEVVTTWAKLNVNSHIHGTIAKWIVAASEKLAAHQPPREGWPTRKEIETAIRGVMIENEWLSHWAVRRADVPKVADAILALTGAGKVEGWRDIANAPKDRDLWLFGRDGNKPMWSRGRWKKDIYEYWEQVSEKRQELRTRDDSRWETDADWFEVTHFQELTEPLPAAPAAGQKEAPCGGQ